MKKILHYALIVYALVIIFIAPALAIIGHIINRQFFSMGEFAVAVIILFYAMDRYFERYPMNSTAG